MHVNDNNNDEDDDYDIDDQINIAEFADLCNKKLQTNATISLITFFL